MLSCFNGISNRLTSQVQWDTVPNPVRSSIQSAYEFLLRSVLLCPKNRFLIRKCEVLHQNRVPVVVVAWLTPSIWKTSDESQFAHFFSFAHNTNVWSMGEAVRTGLLRPSACDINGDSWVAPCTFYCRACMIDKPGESGYTSAHILHASAIAAKYGHARNPRFCNLEALPRVPMQQCPKLRSQVCPSRHFSPCVLLSYTTCFIATGGALAPRQGSSPTPGQRCDLFKGGSGRASERIYKIKVNNRESQAQKPT